MLRSIVLAASCLLLALVGVASASTPAGLYVLVEEVELGPQGKEPEWIKIRGVFMNEPSFDDSSVAGPTYGPVQGWGLFGLPNHKQELARLEWRDLASTKGKVVAFGSAYAPVFHPAVAHHIKPDPVQALKVPYLVDHGLYLLRENSEPAKKLLDFRKNNPAPR